MRKLIPIVLCLFMVLALVGCGQTAAPAESSAAPETSQAVVEESTAPATSQPAEESTAAVEKKTIGFYSDAADDYYKVLVETFTELSKADPECDWEVTSVVGASTAAEQLAAVENFITAGCDAICVIQNNADTTSECIAKAKDAGIPYFGACHNFSQVANAKDAAGSCCYDFVQAGVYAGEDALARGVKNVIMIEGVLGQGSAGAQSLGFIKAYEDAGKDIGGQTSTEYATNKPVNGGGKDLNIVLWASGNWMADPAKKIMTDAITSLGADGWDGAYVQNDEMMDGVIQAIQEAGLNPADYWLGASNGKEKSWTWVKDGTTKMDVNQTAALEGDVIYQQVKAYFAGETYRKYIHPYLTPFNTEDIASKQLLPFSDVAEYIKQRTEGKFVYDLNDPKFIDNPGYAG
jgi:ABC-type sugar transport system substrate-binding protein